MAPAASTEAGSTSAALSRLIPLAHDQYFIAFGAGDQQFCGTPNGYAAVRLPSLVVKDLSDSDVLRVTWASFSSDHIDSYFVVYEMMDGVSAYRIGKEIPWKLRAVIHKYQRAEKPLPLRVQLGPNQSWVIWAGNSWACGLIPEVLQDALCRLSSWIHTKNGCCCGSFDDGPISNVTWHSNGSYYIKSTKDFWNFKSAIMKQGWNDLWNAIDRAGTDRSFDVAFVAINPNSPTGDTFAFIMKKTPWREPDFVLRFEPEEIVMRLPQPYEDQVESQWEPEPGMQSNKSRDLISLSNPNNDPRKMNRVARSLKNGRPHPNDTLELKMKAGERVIAIEYRGRDWYIVRNERGKEGWAHGTWLSFSETPEDAYTRWEGDSNRWFRSGMIRVFLSPASYMNHCKMDKCKTDIGICAHDLERLIRGSGRYSVGFLKELRTRYHPDMFARHCHPDVKEDLSTKAETLFVLFGMLIDEELKKAE